MPRQRRARLGPPWSHVAKEGRDRPLVPGRSGAARPRARCRNSALLIYSGQTGGPRVSLFKREAAEHRHNELKLSLCFTLTRRPPLFSTYLSKLPLLFIYLFIHPSRSKKGANAHVRVDLNGRRASPVSYGHFHLLSRRFSILFKVFMSFYYGDPM